ncbi:RWD-domain-containing protein [Xylariomycetidae sp. FL0641]|nr:RWD-domain-containing protein [Xylariomycetidae sp. FL0641]
MGREEQIEEREVLDSIFPEEIQDISETEYRITIKLDIPPSDEDGETPDEPPAMVLHVRYPAGYPDEAPDLDLLPALDGGSHPRFSVAEDKHTLLSGLQDTIQENLGMAMVFTLVTTLTEAAEALIASRREAAARAREEVALEAERKENAKFHGTPVTPETFMKWREGFLAEMEERRRREEEERAAELKKARVKEPVRLTGRQLWERGLAGKGEDDEDDVPTEGVERLKVEA